MVEAVMKMKAYIRVVSHQSAITAIYEETSLPGATMKQLKAKRGDGTSSWWNWQTEWVLIDSDSPDEGLRGLLSKHRPIFPAIRKHSGPECDIYLEILTEYRRGEEPRGLYLSSDTIALLNELGAALDNDVIVRE
jgi:hypothetical protein